MLGGKDGRDQAECDGYHYQSAPAPQNDGGYEPQSGDFPEDIPF